MALRLLTTIKAAGQYSVSHPLRLPHRDPFELLPTGNDTMMFTTGHLRTNASIRGKLALATTKHHGRKTLNTVAKTRMTEVRTRKFGHSIVWFDGLSIMNA
jgi:hypothetical protein